MPKGISQKERTSLYLQRSNKNSPLISRIINNIRNVGFKIERTYRVFEMHYPWFLILKSQ